jgi:hypothetical protein
MRPTNRSSTKKADGAPGHLLDSSQDSSGKREQSADEVEGSSYNDPDEPERQKEDPDQWIENDRNNCERPARDEEDTKEEQLEHRCFSPARDTKGKMEKFLRGGMMVRWH